jgi:hypothetical protein
MNSAGDYSTHVGVDYRNVLLIGETCHCSRGVGADARQRQEGVDILRDDVIVFGSNDCSAFMQTLGPSRIAEFAPRP